jgi:hypothetical protein
MDIFTKTRSGDRRIRRQEMKTILDYLTEDFDYINLSPQSKTKHSTLNPEPGCPGFSSEIKTKKVNDMIELFKSFLKSALTIYQTTRNLDTALITQFQNRVDYLQQMQCKKFQITEFDSINSTGWTFDYSAGTMTNSSGTTKHLVSNPVILNNFSIRKILLEGTSLTGATLSYTTGTNLATATWTTVSTGVNSDLNLLLTSVPATGIRFRITSGDAVVNNFYLIFDLE